MKTGDLINAYRTGIKKLLKHYNNLLEDFKPGDIHHFRVEVKKQKSLLHLVSSSLQKSQVKIPATLKSFYDLTGNIRNLQLHRQRITDLCNDLLLEIPANYLQFLAEEETALRKQVRQLAEDISIKDFESKLIDETPQSSFKGSAINFIRKSRNRLEELLELSFYTDEALHEIRKILKRMAYNSPYIEQGGMLSFFQGLHGIKSINAITLKLGEYHDLCIGISLLGSTYVTEIADIEESKILNELELQLQLRKDVMKIEVAEMMKQLKQRFESESMLEY